MSFFKTVVFRQVLIGPKKLGQSPFVITVFKDEALITLYFIRHLADVIALLVNPGLICRELISVLAKDLRQFMDVIPVLRNLSRHFRIGNAACPELISFLPDLKEYFPNISVIFPEVISRSPEVISLFPEVIPNYTEAISRSPEAFRM